MIRPDTLTAIGTITKLHALKGEVVCQWDEPALADCVDNHLLLLIDGIHTPFFIAQQRERSATTSILHFDDIDTPEAAAPLIGCQVFIEQSAIDEAIQGEDMPSLRLFIGFAVSDEQCGALGHIVDVDDQTQNLLFIVETPEGEELLIPAHPDLIAAIDPEQHLIHMRLPDGLLK